MRRPDRVAVLVRVVMPLVTLVALFSAAARMAVGRLDNDDTFFHLRFGHEFLTGWSPRDPGSVSDFATRDWVPTQWLGQVAMAAAEDAGGLAAVAWLTGSVTLAYVLVLYLVCREHAAPLVAVLVTAAAFLASIQGISARPQMVSYLLTTLTVAAWLRTGTDGRTRWWLIPMTWLWAMLHGMWPVSVVIGVAGAVGVVIDRRLRGRQLALVAAIPVACLLAGAVTPVGPRLVSEILVVGGRGQYFEEWQPPTFTDWPPLLVAALLAVAAVAWMRSRAGWTPILLLLVAAAWMVYSARTVPVAAASAAPLAAIALGAKVPGSARPRIPDRWFAVGGAAAASALLAVAVATGSTQAGPAQPDWVDESMSALPDGAPVLNQWGWGGHLMWAHPQLELVMSGYGDIYTDAELDRNFDISTLRPGWDREVERTGAAFALLDPDSRLAYVLVEVVGWDVVCESQEAVLLHRPDDAATHSPNGLSDGCSE